MSQKQTNERKKEREGKERRGGEGRRKGGKRGRKTKKFWLVREHWTECQSQSFSNSEASHYRRSVTAFAGVPPVKWGMGGSTV